ncbi:MAG: hypothetical protein ACKVQR_24545 [Aquabacterium sp.]
MTAPAALTHSSWINAWALHRACRRAGVALYTSDDAHGLPVPRLPQGQAVAWELMTDESALRRALQGQARGRFEPASYPLELLDDKWAFAQWLAQDPHGPQPLPQWALDAPDARYPLLLKARHSWVGSTKLPRGWVCHSANELRRRRAELPALGLQEGWFFLQAWRGDDAVRLWSVAGYFDAGDEVRSQLLLTERVASDTASGPGSSAMLVTLGNDDPSAAAAVQACKAVLRRLHYRGPLEMEFIAAADSLQLLELNPRLWMQHGLFEAWGNGLVRRCLGQDTADDHTAARRPPPPLLWVNGIWWLQRLLRLDLSALQACWRLGRSAGRQVLVQPPLRIALLVPLRRLLRRWGRAASWAVDDHV